MRKKITIKDIAKEAGVSVATVSYVMNDRTEERISEETRRKVLQIANLLNYTPNQSAKALATNRSHNVAVYLSPDVSPLKRAEQLHFLNELSMYLNARDYQLIYFSQKEQMHGDNMDSIICYDISIEDSYVIGNRNFLPLLFVDGCINDPLFFQIAMDYEKLRVEVDKHFPSGNYTAACLEMHNEASMHALKKAFPSVMLIHTLKELNQLKNQNVVVWEETLHQLLAGSSNLYYHPSVTPKKLDKVMECMELAINRVPEKHHTFLL